MAYMQCPECKLTVPATATYLRGDQCPRCLTTMEPRDRFRTPMVGARSSGRCRRPPLRPLANPSAHRAGRATLADRHAPILLMLPMLVAVLAFAACGDDSSVLDETLRSDGGRHRGPTEAATEAPTEAPAEAGDRPRSRRATPA